MLCPTCKGPMSPLLTSWFCPKDCDRPAATSPDMWPVTPVCDAIVDGVKHKVFVVDHKELSRLEATGRIDRNRDYGYWVDGRFPPDQRKIDEVARTNGKWKLAISSMIDKPHEWIMYKLILLVRIP